MLKIKCNLYNLKQRPIPKFKKKRLFREEIQVQGELVPSIRQPHLQSCFHSYGESGRTDQFGGITATSSCL